MKRLSFALLFLTVFSSHQLFAQAGFLDTTFNNDGRVITAVTTHNDVAFSVFMQPDGKIVAVGNSKSGDYDFALTRYNPDGSLDATFGTGGEVITQVGTSNDHALFGGIRPNGKIIAAGNSFNGTDYDIAVVQYNSDGTPDVNFGTNGIVTTSIGLGDDQGFGMSLQSDGKIVVAGYTVNSLLPDSDFAVVRYDTTGALDATFGTNGIVTTDFNNTIEVAHDVKLDATQKIVVAGDIMDSGRHDFALARYMQDGTLDISFSNDGKVITPFDSNAYAYSIAMQPDGKIIVAGHAGDAPYGDFAMARYNKDGSIDSTFGINGKVVTDIQGSDDAIYAVTLQPDGKIVAAGYSFNLSFTQRYAAVARYNSNGTLDNSFGVGGKVTTLFGNSGDEYRGMCLQQDGKIVTCGFTNNGNDNDFALARYLTDFALGVINFSSKENPVFIFPNPMQSTEELDYTLTKDEMLSVALYDASSKLVQTFFTNKNRSAGAHKEELKLNENLAAGNYVLTLSNGLRNVSVKMVKH